VAEFFGKTYDEFISVGEALLEAEGKAMAENTGSMSGTAPAPTMTGNMVSLVDQHKALIEEFQQKELALEINRLLLAVERNNPALLEVIKAQLSGMAAECYPAPPKKRISGEGES
jgi:hypothetical protein